MIPNYNLARIKHPFKARLAKEHINLHEFCELNNKISYTVVQKIGKIPSEYELTYKLNSIIAIDDNQLPVFGDEHVVSIKLPPKYPMEAPVIYARSDVWHPNIKYTGKQKGRVCGNTKGFGKLYDLSMLAQRVGEILEYKNYHATNTIPFPEDETVAKWVRNFAEPHNIINKEEGISTDPQVPMEVVEEEAPIIEVKVPVKEEEVVEEVKVVKEVKEPTRRKFVIKRKEDNTPPPKPERKRFRFGR